MVAWIMTLCTPEYPKGREVILIANDLTHLIGSFSIKEYLLFNYASQLARAKKIPRVCFNLELLVICSLLFLNMYDAVF